MDFLDLFDLHDYFSCGVRVEVRFFEYFDEKFFCLLIFSFWHVEKPQVFSPSVLLESDVALFLLLYFIFQSLDFVSKLSYLCFIGRYIALKINFIDLHPGVLERLFKIHHMLLRIFISLFS